MHSPSPKLHLAVWRYLPYDESRLGADHTEVCLGRTYPQLYVIQRVKSIWSSGPCLLANSATWDIPQHGAEAGGKFSASNRSVTTHQASRPRNGTWEHSMRYARPPVTEARHASEANSPPEATVGQQVPCFFFLNIANEGAK